MRRGNIVAGPFGRPIVFTKSRLHLQSQRWVRAIQFPDRVYAHQFVSRLSPRHGFWRTFLSLGGASGLSASTPTDVKIASLLAESRLFAYEIMDARYHSGSPIECQLVAPDGGRYEIVPADILRIRLERSALPPWDASKPMRSVLSERSVNKEALTALLRELDKPVEKGASWSSLAEGLWEAIQAGNLRLLERPSRKPPTESTQAAELTRQDRPAPLAPPPPAGASIVAPASVTPNLHTLHRPRDLKDAAVRRALFTHYEVEVGTYKDLKAITKPGYQREHFVPHSCFMTRSKLSDEKRSEVPIDPDFGSYDEDEAITYFVFDDQSKGTEHRYLTDVEKKYAQHLESQGKYASVREWLDHMEDATAASLKMDTIERAPGVYEARVPEEDAVDVARAIRIEYENKLEVMGVNKDAPMSNLVGGGTTPATDEGRDIEDFD